MINYKTMKFKYILGVDMSKSWFHFCVKDKTHTILWEDQIVNEPDPILEFIKQLKQELNVKNLDDIILCIEHTGIYVQHLTRAWLMKGGRMSIIAANKIS